MKRQSNNAKLETLVSLAKRRGLIFQSSEIYGGVGSIYDYGPVGVELKRNIREMWWRTMVSDRDDVVGIETSIIMHPEVWISSGHVAGFSDPLSECLNCHHRYRDDQIEGRECPECGGELTEPRQFNLMFNTFMGPVQEDAARVYLRPETAQGIFVNFENVLNTTRRKLPFGIAQIGKSFRNEITPGNFIFRMREFEQMEMEYFCKPGEAEGTFRQWVNLSMEWFTHFGIRSQNLRLREHSVEERPHYAVAATDIEYRFPWGWGELETINNRSDYDLRNHMKGSGRDLTYFDDDSKDRYLPHVIEPAFGVDRSLLAYLADAYDEEEIRGKTRTVLRFHPKIAPNTVAVLPLSRNETLIPTAPRLFEQIKTQFAVQYDDSQSIGRRYRRQDEIGTPLCVTVDFDTVNTDQSVTIRNRDTMAQIRVPITALNAALSDELAALTDSLSDE